jgi:hypothetical protein
VRTRALSSLLDDAQHLDLLVRALVVDDAVVVFVFFFDFVRRVGAELEPMSDVYDCTFPISRSRRLATIVPKIISTVAM